MEGVADPAHIRLLCQGVTEWNRRRKEHPFTPDLTHLEIRNADLSGADLRETDFDGSRLHRIDLRAAALQKARLNGVDITRTSLAAADLTGAQMLGANLTYVSLQGAALGESDCLDLKVRHSDLRRAHLGGGRLHRPHFYNCDLRALDTTGAEVTHALLKRCLIDGETLPMLEALGFEVELLNLPRREEWVDWGAFEVRPADDDFGVILHQGRRHWISEGRWHFFICHASADKAALAAPLAAALEELDMNAWYDDTEVAPGDDIADAIDFGLRGSLFGVVVISGAFLTKTSRWREEELAALSHKRLFIVLHGVDVDDLVRFRPELAGEHCVSSSIGIRGLARELVDAIERPRKHD